MGAARALKENWLGFATAGLVGGLVMGVFNIQNSLTQVATKQDQMHQRLDRIASALPDIGARVAHEETKRRFEGAVVVISPLKTPTGEWVSPVHFIVAASNQRETYLVPLRGPDDRRVSLLVSGIAASHDRNALTILEASKYAALAADPAPAPSWAEGDSSFLLSKNVDVAKAMFDSSVKEWFPGTRTGKTALGTDVTSWKTLSEGLLKNERGYTVGSFRLKFVD